MPSVRAIITFTPCFKVFTGKVPFPKSTDAQVVHSVSKGGRPPKPPGGEELGLRPKVWELTMDCWNQECTKRPDIATVFQRFREIMTPGLSFPGTGDRDRPSGGGSTSPRIFRRGLRRNSVQERINRLDQASEPMAQQPSSPDTALRISKRVPYLKKNGRRSSTSCASYAATTG